tara:strand:+ start:84 stop:995 length:912 start_codon:yes stop_codon:yes gene_type:complete
MIKHRSMQQLGFLLICFFTVSCSEQESSTTSNVAQNGSGGMTVRDTPKGLDYEFYKESIEPIFIRYRGGFVGSDTACVACHTVQANAPLGLVALTEDNGEVYWTEEQSRQNFENVAMLVDPSDPESSRLLLAPLSPTAGGERHSGGIFWNSTDHSEYRLFADWIATGDPTASADPVVDVDFEFFRSCVQPIFVNPIDNAMPCTECHSGVFAIPPPVNAYWTEEQSRIAFEELIYLIDPGRPDSSRFLHKPLHPNAGGDLMHNGGRRWYSKDDPERQALASWIRGDSVGSQCPSALQFDDPPRS